MALLSLSHWALPKISIIQRGGQGDQSYLNAFFKSYGEIIPLSHKYNIGKNVVRCKFEAEWNPPDFFVFHFAGNDDVRSMAMYSIAF